MNRHRIRPGDVLWNGATVTAPLARAYNAQRARIESFRAAGKAVPEELLNGAHNLLNHAQKEE